MRPECIEAVSKAIGRQLSPSEAQKIEQRIIGHKKQLAIKDRQAYLGLSETERLTEAAKGAAEQIKAEALKKQQRIANTILANQRLTGYLNHQPGTMLDNLDRIIAPRLDGKDRIQSAETKFKVINNEFTRALSDEIAAFGPKMLGIISNDQAMEPVYRELRGQDTGISSRVRCAYPCPTTSG